MDEFLALAYYKEKHLPIVVARLFNTVGPRQTGRYGMVLPNFVRQALEGRDLTVFGDGSQSRSFTHVSDAVWALLRLAEVEQAVGQVFNVGTDEEITINELAIRVIALSHSSSQIVKIPYLEAYGEGFEDMPRRVPDLGKINRLIGYAPKVSLDDSIRAMIDYHLSDQ